MAWRLKIKERARKEIERIPIKDQRRIFAALTLLENNPYMGKKLGGKFSDLRSCRIWPYRILYQVFANVLIIVIVSVGHR
jgi:addiction module RelE/StbE family toxin